MATTKPATALCTERVNLSLTKEERSLLEQIASVEDRDMTYVAAWLVRWGLDQYRNLGMTLTEMKNADYFTDDVAREQRARIRLELRREVQRRVVPETIKQRKRA